MQIRPTQTSHQITSSTWRQTGEVAVVVCKAYVVGEMNIVEQLYDVLEKEEEGDEEGEGKVEEEEVVKEVRKESDEKEEQLDNKEDE